jgi:hypothetical protein
MIPSNPSETTRRRYRDNILAAYDRATEDQKLKGKQWYPVAHDLAEMISGGDVVKGAGVIAALSANKSWAENVKLSARAFASGKPSGHTKVMITKAVRIMNGEDPVRLLGGLKTGNFYQCILDPSDPQPVCIDRHAHDVAVGRTFGNQDRGLSAKGRYDALADAYRAAADRIGILPQELQAIVWVAHVETLRGKSTRGHKH